VTQQETVLRGGRVIDPASGLDSVTDVWLADGCIAGLGAEPWGAAWESVDVSGLVLCPGLVDIHVHLREPGQEHKETIDSGTAAAVAGGFTTVCCMPNTTPPVERPERVAALLGRIAEAARCRVFVLGGATLEGRGEVLSDFTGLLAAGCAGITDDAIPLQSVAGMSAALRALAGLDAAFVAHCELKALSRRGVMNEGVVSEGLEVEGQPVAAESEALRRWGEAMEEGGAREARLHLAHVSARATLEVLAGLRAAGGAGLTAETAPHYFALSEAAVRDFGANAKMNPPLRSEADRRAIRAAVCDGTIGIIATDHAPHSPSEKAAGLVDAPFGVVGLETSLGVVLTELAHTGEMPLPRALAAMSCNPAQALGLRGESGGALGRLAVGADADVTVLDLEREWVVDPEGFRSKGRNTPFAGQRLRGRAWGTMVGGVWRMREYELL
jgi:dihydroorotase